ncbi:hypothetical protein EJ05DRAFT_379856 [Pseudovirgaria hyperparasitica]|uniref:Translation machinery-associated protein 16 n=1 Tax=Pseudovirgaria hyperparasitica TaxID=470096 RepID=A0A6A6W5H1_9PEZI|nr:uncharacterized protein EJ05DRAFT_379856 [Pseudovirgaria hyperparasitica]KAF2758178.1 hypothetical protein EJ05DRAFT_379856 [Pseudovirgaria hyperparasitica]
MPTKTFTKVQKHIAKKKGKNAALHEHSRDSHRLQRAAMRDDKVQRITSARAKQNQPLLQRIAWFHGIATERDPPLDISTIQGLIRECIHRDDEELGKLKSERRAGRPPSTREVMLKQRVDEETKEHKSGFYLPDLEDEKNIDALKEWNGDYVALNTVNFVRISDDGTKHQSKFPPRQK